MRRALALMMTFCVLLTFSLDADARRFGGGRSWGAAPSHQPRQAPRAEPGTAPNASPGRQTPAGGARWLGPLAGLAAGGLLASLFMGGAFDGVKLFDILLIGLVAFIAFRFIAARRQPAAATAQPGSSPAPRQPNQQFFGSAAPVASGAPINAPAWFDEARFLEAAREHFMALQEHWDRNDMQAIAEFVTPDLLGYLQEERSKAGESYQSTYIDDLRAQLDGVDDGLEKTVATVTFSGVEKSSRFNAGESFSESWRMEREQGENKPWVIAGIRQN